MSESSSSNIQTFLRIRPSKVPSGYFGTDELNPNSLVVKLPAAFKSEYINNSKKNHGFQFSGIIPMTSTQEDVFAKVGNAAVRNALDGYNSTIFACKWNIITFGIGNLFSCYECVVVLYK